VTREVGEPRLTGAMPVAAEELLGPGFEVPGDLGVASPDEVAELLDRDQGRAGDLLAGVDGVGVSVSVPRE
jgi:hypothetical protein